MKFISGMQGCFLSPKSINIVHCIKIIKGKNHTSISKNAEKYLAKSNTSHDKTSQQTTNGKPLIYFRG